MRFYAAFHSLDVLDGARSNAIAGHFPHLRLVSLIPGSELQSAVESLPRHVRDRIVVDPSPELLASGQIEVMLSTNPAQTQASFPAVTPSDIVTWPELAQAYDRWLDTHYLPFHAFQATFTPDGLFPVDWQHPHVTIELIGSCGAGFLAEAVPAAASEFGGQISCFHTILNHPGEIATAASAQAPDLRVVVPPLRYMHPATLDGFVDHPDHDRLFAETRSHMLAYLETAAATQTGAPLFVTGFIEPYMNADGIFYPTRELSNFKYFVRCLNDALVDWCAERSMAHFIDANEIAAGIGKHGVEEGTLSFFSHRTPLDRAYDDGVDIGCPTVAVARSFAVRSPAYWIALIREVLHRHVTIGATARVKAVIVDLDNTLWRGLASDGVVGSWNGRPHGIAEALKILKRRGIFLAIASKNDESYIREHWDEILGDWSEVPLGMPLSLAEFDVVKIDFRPKSVTIAEILAELNVLPDSAVFVDDNALEREEVQAAFPELRILGAEMNYVRRELLHSPFTQSDLRTTEDAVRSATAKQQALLKRHHENGSASNFLESLRLKCAVREVVDSDSPEGQRAAQLINKTNQWNLNGRRVAAGEINATLAAGGDLLIAEVRDELNRYGVVGAALIDRFGRVSHLVVSCRVIGMGIDDAFVHQLLAGLGPLKLAFADSGRNRAARAFLERHQGAPVADAEIGLDCLAAPSHVELEAPHFLALTAA